jgi:hypothetical protein
MKAIFAGMAAERYADGTSSGFIISHQSQIHIAGRYAQKVETTEKVTDPLGNTLEFPVVHFLQQGFELFARPPHLLLVNSGSIAKALVGRLLEFCDFGISVEPVMFAPEKVLSAFSQMLEPVTVYAASIDQLSISPETSARLTFESSGKLKQDVRQFLKPRRFKFTNIKFQFEFAGQSRRCEIKSSGAVCLFGEEDPALLATVLDLLQPFISAPAE